MSTFINWHDYKLTYYEQASADEIYNKMLKQLTEEKLAEFNPEIIHNSAIEATVKYFEAVRRINEKMAQEHYKPIIEKYIAAKRKMQEAFVQGVWNEEAQKALDFLKESRYALDGASLSKYPQLEEFIVEDGAKMFGRFEIPEDGKLFATDPCYINVREDRAEIDDIDYLGCRVDVSPFLKNGYKHLEAWVSIEDSNPSILYLMLPDTAPEDVYNTRVIGSVGVDSGTISFFRIDKVSNDGKILDRFKGEAFEQWWEDLASFGRSMNSFYGDYGMSPEMDFVISGTYSGDGEYNVLELFDSSGELIGFCIDTNYDYEEDDYEEDWHDEEYEQEDSEEYEQKYEEYEKEYEEEEAEEFLEDFEEES